MDLKTYLRRPVPSRRGFGPYRSPGPAVHLPVTLFLLAPVGIFGGGHPLWVALLVLQLVPALYLGRDVAIWAHYFPPLAWAVYALALAALTVLLPTLSDWRAHHAESAHLLPAVLPLGGAWGLLVLRLLTAHPPRDE